MALRTSEVGRSFRSLAKIREFRLCALSRGQNKVGILISGSLIYVELAFFLTVTMDMIDPVVPSMNGISVLGSLTV